MPKQDSLQGSLDLLVLKVLSRKPGLHGYAIMSEIRLLSDELLRVEEGSLYPALHRMKESGLLAAKWATGDGGRRRKQYRLTPAGRKAQARMEEQWLAVSDAVQLVLQRL